MKNILKNIKEIRTKLSYSQEYTASQLGIEQVSYGLIENGKRKLRYETLEQIALIFRMNVIDIITYPDIYVRNESVIDSDFVSKFDAKISEKNVDYKDKYVEMLEENRELRIELDRHKKIHAQKATDAMDALMKTGS